MAVFNETIPTISLQWKENIKFSFPLLQEFFLLPSPFFNVHLCSFITIFIIFCVLVSIIIVTFHIDWSINWLIGKIPPFSHPLYHFLANYPFLTVFLPNTSIQFAFISVFYIKHVYRFYRCTPKLPPLFLFLHTLFFVFVFFLLNIHPVSLYLSPALYIII